VPRDCLQDQLPVPAPGHERLFQQAEQVSSVGRIATLLGQVRDKAALVSNTLLSGGNVLVS